MLNKLLLATLFVTAQPAAAAALPQDGVEAPPAKGVEPEPEKKSALARPRMTLAAPPVARKWEFAPTYASASAAREGRLARSAVPEPQAAAASAPGIADNSFLIEEAYNQEYGVVQHISAFQRAISGDGWEYGFTQEWPFNPAPRSQLSYTVFATSGGVPGSSSGIGDVLLNYRYQAIGDGSARVAFSPRASLLVPSGSARHGRGAGGVGMQFNLPVSWKLADRLVTHWNAGTTIVPHAKNSLGETATTYNYFLGQSFIYAASPRFNLMLEMLFDSSQSVVAQDRAAWENSVVINPGFRWAHNFESGLQIVPGIAFPVEVGNSGRGNWGIFLYLSFEHPFGRGAP